MDENKIWAHEEIKRRTGEDVDGEERITEWVVNVLNRHVIMILKGNQISIEWRDFKDHSVGEGFYR